MEQRSRGWLGKARQEESIPLVSLLSQNKAFPLHPPPHLPAPNSYHPLRTAQFSQLEPRDWDEDEVDVEGRWGDGARRESGDQKDEHVFSLVLIPTLGPSVPCTRFVVISKSLVSQSLSFHI